MKIINIPSKQRHELMQTPNTIYTYTKRSAAGAKKFKK